VEIALWRPSHGSLELAEGSIMAGKYYAIERSLIGLLAVAVLLFLDAPIEDSQPHLLQKSMMYVISQPLSRFPSVTSSMIGGVNQAKCAPPILPSQDRAVDHHDFTKKTEVKLPDSSREMARTEKLNSRELL
jgi:hypothetical protein